MKKEKVKNIIKKSPVVIAILSPAIKIRRHFLEKANYKKKKIVSDLNKILVEDPVVKFEEFNGIFAIDSASDLFFRKLVHKEYEPELINICLKHLHPKKDVIDIGANIGFYTVLFAKNTDQKVLAIEPTKNALSRLYRNIELNNVKNRVEVFEGVISKENGTTEIKTIKGKEEYSSLGGMNHPSILDDQWLIEKVTSITLDDLINKKSLNPGFIKIDVEGAENLVLSGAKKVLTENRPVIVSELSDYLLKKNGSSAKEVISFIESFDYTVIDPLNPLVKPGTSNFGDILCIPN